MGSAIAFIGVWSNSLAGALINYLASVVSQRFSEERELLRLKFRMFVRLGWCK
jgi:hypothetical protein